MYGTINWAHLISQILIFLFARVENFTGGLHGISPLFRYAYSLQQKFDLLIYFRVLTIQNLDFSLNYWS